MAAFQDLSLQERMLLTFEAEEFLYREGALLDEKKLDEWLELLTEDIHYWMPIRRTTTAKEVDREFTRQGGMAFFDDDKNTLGLRIQRLSAGRAWAEDPPSRTRRMVTNVRILNIEGHEILTTCNFQLYRTRLNSEEDSWIGRREDLLRRVDGELKLARRHIFLEQTVILAQNMSNLF
ncbi:MAG: 3-phenylpropionate/cinnamic acid dioxygenase subunit beta [Gammaproteobacteria bacterium]|jgi:biphenyl 2,3-dioxygenase beta subunit|nr:MAG: 3-phenylpropionate/cinnamic acid dioxygenase subunit beta [Gammaproteobacteria bacterium]